MTLSLTDQQLKIISSPAHGNIFLEGPAGAGKTTVGVERLLALLEQGIPASQILVMVPQRTLALPYDQAVRDSGMVPGGVVDILTFAGLARRLVDLFWPLVAETAGFGKLDKLPTFLNIESAQFHMARIVRPLLDEGHFESATIDRNRLYSQILDNLNKSAFVGFPHTEIGSRLQSSAVQESSQLRIYADAQDCANRFRQYCLENNLLDFSLLLNVFQEHILLQPQVTTYLQNRYKHIILDNIEEDTPAAHDFHIDFLGGMESALVIYDWDGGYRRFLGADPHSAQQLREICDSSIELTESFIIREPIKAFTQSLSFAMGQADEPAVFTPDSVITVENKRYYTEMLDWVSDQIRDLVVNDTVPPGEIVVLAPYLSDVLRFSLMNRLDSLGIPVRSHRPSRSLREEPAVQSLLTFAKIAHPHWGLVPTKFDVAYALVQAVDTLDLVRAQLLTDILYRVRDGIPVLDPFDQIKPEMQSRISFAHGQQYENLRQWLDTYTVNPVDELDHFLRKLFGEVLSQPDYRFHLDFDAGKAAANLIDSARNFRWMVGDQILEDGDSVGKTFLQTVEDGLIASQYLRSWHRQEEDAVLLAPAYTFLMSNRPVDYQFWLNVSSSGWWERLYQPLTHPYVLSRQWEPERPWTDMDEVEANQETMHRVISGLLHHCREHIFLGLSDFDEQGFEEKGPLLKAINKALRVAGISQAGGIS